MDNWKNNTIWFEDIPQDELLLMDYKTNKSDIFYLADKKYAVLWHYNNKNKDFTDIPVNNSIEYLQLNLANCTSFMGIERLRGIKRLELHYCTKLETDYGLSSLKDSLEWLHIDMSKKIKLSSEILQLKKLKVLCLNNCGSLDSLDFLNGFQNLVDFRFVSTKITDGNLTPILNHPNLINAGFLNKRNFNYKSEYIEKLLETKSVGRKQYIHKGEWVTFRYDVFK